MLRDETGRVVRLGDYYRHGRPVLLNFVYYNCPMLCPMVLEGMTSTLTELTASPAPVTSTTLLAYVGSLSTAPRPRSTRHPRAPQAGWSR